MVYCIDTESWGLLSDLCEGDKRCINSWWVKVNRKIVIYLEERIIRNIFVSSQ